MLPNDELVVGKIGNEELEERKDERPKQNECEKKDNRDMGKKGRGQEKNSGSEREVTLS